MADAGQGAIEFLRRHVTGDWGELTPEDWAENELSVKEGFRILSAVSYQQGREALSGSVPDMDIGGFNVLRILGIKNHRIQI